MKLFVTGGTGVLGKRVVKQFASQGAEVVVLSRSDENDRQIIKSGAQPVRGDIFHLAEVIRASYGCDVILHLATHVPRKPMPKRSDWLLNDRLRTDATRILIRAAEANGIKKMVIPSLVALYGERKGETVTRNSPLPERLNPLFQSAFDMEQTVIHANTEFVILRFGTYYGEDCFHTREMIRDVKNRKMPLLGDGSFFMNMIHVDDAASAVVFVVNHFDRCKNQIINVSDFNPQTYASLLSMMVRQTGGKKPLKIPMWLAKIVLGDGFDYVTASFKITHDPILEGWQPQHSFEETVRCISEESINSYA